MLGTAGLPDLAVTTGSTSFAFAGTLASGSAYDLHIVRQPTNPSQQCEMTNKAGTVAGVDVTNIGVVCGGIPLTAINVTNATVEASQSVTMAVAYTPSNATDKSLTWKVCNGPPSGTPLTCTGGAAATYGTITSAGRYTAPASVPTNPFRVNVLACQNQICDAATVDVTAVPVIDSFTASPQTLNSWLEQGEVTLSWSVRHSTRVLLRYLDWEMQRYTEIDVTGLQSLPLWVYGGGDFTLIASNATTTTPVTKSVTVWMDPLTVATSPIVVTGFYYTDENGATRLGCSWNDTFFNAGGETATVTSLRYSWDGGVTWGGSVASSLPVAPDATAQWWPGANWAVLSTFTATIEYSYTVPSNKSTFRLVSDTVTCNPPGESEPQ